ncbi:MAG: tRNA 2-thiouridine(34) synthase MnmA [Syntrophaceae bacterium]|nr:tRNA 2-thiouridine(34) synthase MnmA [Syntrophaceae bacterium]
MKNISKKVLVAMSGGVDSSVAALLLCEAGYDVTGATMLLGVHQDSGQPGRFTDEAANDAAAVCAQLNIGHLTFSFADLMEEKVIGKFIKEYSRGRTPNPCVDCNRHLKFGALVNKARELGFDYLATGHYARIEKDNNAWHLLRPKDRIKDQSYFLYVIRANDLPFILFPLGDLSKDEVRKKAKKAGLKTAHRTESQDICFVPEGKYGRVFSDRGIVSTPGDILDTEGNILGRHKGIIHYTIGQRGGLGVSAKQPLYVLEIDARENQVVVGRKEDLLSSVLIAGELNLLSDNFPAQLEAKIRYRKKPAPCRVEKTGDKLKVVFEEPQESITPGQSVVFYNGEEVIGGGLIESID